MKKIKYVIANYEMLSSDGNVRFPDKNYEFVK